MNAPLHAGTRAATLTALRDRFERAGIVTAAAEAEALLLHGLGLSRAALWCEPGAAIGPEDARALESLASRRERRVPLQHLIGEVDFHDVTLNVEPGVFIPRPETETLVEASLDALRSAGAPASGRLLDLGTGTGAVAIALLQALPGWHGDAVARSPAAVALAVRNAARNDCSSRLRVSIADFSVPPAALGGATAWEGAPYDLVVANPPYIATGDLDALMPEVRDFDPREALDGGPDGLAAYRAIVGQLPRVLRNGGVLALEIGEDQADDLLVLLGPGLASPHVRNDLAGRPRIITGSWRGGVE
jgi:release factor glutamine methyltransferase